MFTLRLRSDEILAVLIEHQRVAPWACSCGFSKWGASWAEHVVEQLAKHDLDLEDAPPPTT